MAPDGDVVDLQQRRPAADEPEHPFECDRVVKVAAHAQQALLERVDAGELAAAEAQPRLGIGGHRHVRAPARPALADSGGAARAAHLPGVAEVT